MTRHMADITIQVIFPASLSIVLPDQNTISAFGEPSNASTPTTKLNKHNMPNQANKNSLCFICLPSFPNNRFFVHWVLLDHITTFISNGLTYADIFWCSLSWRTYGHPFYHLKCCPDYRTKYAVSLSLEQSFCNFKQRFHVVITQDLLEIYPIWKSWKVDGHWPFSAIEPPPQRGP